MLSLTCVRAPRWRRPCRPATERGHVRRIGIVFGDGIGYEPVVDDVGIAVEERLVVGQSLVKGVKRRKRPAVGYDEFYLFAFQTAVLPAVLLDVLCPACGVAVGRGDEPGERIEPSGPGIHHVIELLDEDGFARPSYDVVARVAVHRRDGDLLAWRYEQGYSVFAYSEIVECRSARRQFDVEPEVAPAVRGRRIHRYGARGRYLFEHHHAPLGAGDAPGHFRPVAVAGDGERCCGAYRQGGYKKRVFHTCRFGVQR